MINTYAVILAGGKGERFWPLSTSKRPKQFLSLVGEGTLLSQAVRRLEGLIPPERVLVITNRELAEAAREAAPELPPENVIGEPVGRDTAAAVAPAAALVEAREPGASFAILTADHVIGDLDLFRATLRGAFTLAAAGDVLLTIGIAPRDPSTAYGYIERDAQRAEQQGIRFFDAVRFVEKPDRARAEGYLATGRYLWNSGMFIWSTSAIVRALQAFQPGLAAHIPTWTQAARNKALDAALDATYPGLTKVSIDYAVMEKARNIVVAEGRFAWDDVGSWTALADHFKADAAGNVAVGDAASVDAAGNIVWSKDRLTALIGVKDLIVVQTEGVTLVCHKDRAQDIKKLLACLREDGRHTELL